jgi:MSHA pilin protein MshD
MNKSLSRGFTLIELIIFIVVVSVGMVGILKVMDVTVKSSADPMVRKQAVALADSILEEIMQKDYAHDASAPVGTNRATYDNVDDYHGLTQTAFTDLPSALSVYDIAIVVAAPLSLNGVPMKKISVTVSRHNGSESVTLTAYRGKV